MYNMTIDDLEPSGGGGGGTLHPSSFLALAVFDIIRNSNLKDLFCKNLFF